MSAGRASTGTSCLGAEARAGTAFSGFLPQGLAGDEKVLKPLTQGAGHAGRQSGAIPAVRAGDGMGCGDRTIRKRAGLGRFPISDCGSTASALVWLAMGDLRYARFNTNGQDLAARAGT